MRAYMLLTDFVCVCYCLTEGDDDRPAKEDCGKFGEFWSQFGRAMKLGIIEDSNNRYSSGGGK